MPRRNKQVAHTPFRYDTARHTKRQFLNKQEAEKAAELQMLAQPGLELSVYSCDICGKWHLTSNPRS